MIKWNADKAKNLIKTVKRHEGFRSRPYKDTEGNLTVGYGRSLSTNPMSESEAEHLMLNDLNKSYMMLQQFWWFRDLDDVRKEVLVELCYNIGIGGVFSFKRMIEALKNSDYVGARDELLDSRWFNQVARSRSNDMGYRLLYGRYKEDVE